MKKSDAGDAIHCVGYHYNVHHPLHKFPTSFQFIDLLLYYIIMGNHGNFDVFGK